MKPIGVNKPHGEGYQAISAEIAEIEAYGGMVLPTSGFPPESAWLAALVGLASWLLRLFSFP